jgi:hypothetical protein
MEVGEVWAYRSKVRGAVISVRVERIGIGRPARVRVSFLGDECEGRTEWVPTSRLKVLWSDRDTFVSHENALDRLAAESTVSAAVAGAARYILDRYVAYDVAWLEHNYLIRDVLTIKQPDVLAEIAGLGADEVLDGGGFWDDEGYRVAWPAAERIVRAIGRKNAEELVSSVHADERTARQEEVTGEVLRGRSRAKDTYVEPEDVASTNEEFWWPVLRVLRDWLGIADPTPEIQMQVLRETGEHAAYIAELAIGYLRDGGQAERAWRLHLQLFPNASKKNWMTTDEIKDRSAKLRESEAWELSSAWGEQRRLEFDQRVADLRRDMWG